MEERDGQFYYQNIALSNFSAAKDSAKVTKGSLLGRMKEAMQTLTYNRRLKDIVIFVNKIKHKLLPQTLHFPIRQWLILQRKREFLLILIFSVTYGKHSLCYLGPKLWNDLTPRT